MHMSPTLATLTSTRPCTQPEPRHLCTESMGSGSECKDDHASFSGQPSPDNSIETCEREDLGPCLSCHFLTTKIHSPTSWPPICFPRLPSLCILQPQQSLCFVKAIYPYWKERQIERGGHHMIPTLNVSLMHCCTLPCLSETFSP